MPKKFSINLTKDAREVVAKFKSAAEQSGVHLTGDEHLGQFNGMGIKGHYDIAGDKLNITIEKKPVLLTWSLIETKVRDFIV